MTTTNRLETIARRQRSGRKRDLMFACFIALVVIFGASAIGTVLFGTASHVAQR
jgi:hypothetical protein